MVNVFMKRTYIYPIVEMSAYVRTSVLCASGDSNPTVTVNADPLNNQIIE